MLDANDHFMDGIGERKPQNFLTHMRSFFGHGRHYWLWDFASTKNALERSGFQKIRRCKIGRNARQGDTAVVGALMGALAGVEEESHLRSVNGFQLPTPPRAHVETTSGFQEFPTR
jgi:hypothetical protein